MRKNSIKNTRINGTITLPNSITSIKDEAFMDNSNIEEVILPSNLLHLLL